VDEVVLQASRRARTVLALGIVAGGIALAWLVGRSDPAPKADAPGGGDQVVLRRRATPQALELAGGPRAALDDSPVAPRAGVSPFRVSAEAAVAGQSTSPDAQPPTLASSFPAVELAASARWGVSMGIGVPGAGIVEQSARTHKIANGDSLPALAKRYLGSEDLADEIFQANRDVLTSPDALPISVELKIPPRKAVRAITRQPAATTELMPIAPRNNRQKDAGKGAPG